MNEFLAATWLILIVSGVLCQLLSARFYNHKRANQNGAIMSLLFLLISLTLVPSIGSIELAFIATLYSLYLIGNALVLYKWQYHPLRTRNQVIKSALYMSAVTLILASLSHYSELITLLSILYVLSVYLCWKALRQLQKSRFTLHKTALTKQNSPTLSVVVPARNETHALTKSIRSLVSSKYSKIEFIVADDCSQDDTSQIIRSFANDGVRFIQSVSPDTGWIGKNQAYKALSDESSGEYLLFSGVDVRYDAGSIEKLMTFMVENKLDMISVLPRHATLRTFGALLQPFRYLHVLFVASKKRPAALSTVWLISRKALDHHGGFEAVKNSVVPEQYFATQLSSKSKYAFVIGTKDLGITTYKKASSQLDTAVRTMYPRMRKLIFNQYIFILGLFGLYVLPIGVLVFVNDVAQTDVRILSAGILFFMALPYLAILMLSYTKTQLLFSPISFVLGVLVYAFASFKSMLMYERNAVLWKGRNICEPIMLNSLKKR